MKGSCLITRRNGTTRREFRDYYESSHAPLGMRFYPFRKYVRNHVLDASGEIDFDVIMETYFDDGADVAAIDTGAVRAVMDVDERHFMEQGLIRSANVEEQVLAGPPLDIAPLGVRRQMLLLRADLSAPETRASIADWGRRLGAGDEVSRVSMDARLQAVGGYGHFPYDAILSLWLRESAKPVTPLDAPRGVTMDVWVTTEVCETPADVLAAALGQSQGAVS